MTYRPSTLIDFRESEYTEPRTPVFQTYTGGVDPKKYQTTNLRHHSSEILPGVTQGGRP